MGGVSYAGRGEPDGSPAFQHIILALISDRRAVWARSGLDQSAVVPSSRSAQLVLSFFLFHAYLYGTNRAYVPLIPLTFSEFQWVAADGSIGGLVLGLWRKPL